MVRNCLKSHLPPDQMLDTINGLLESLNLSAISQLRHLTSNAAAKVVVEVDAGQIVLF